MQSKRILAVMAAALLALAVTGCNTMEGIGKDIQKAGQSIEGAAK